MNGAPMGSIQRSRPQHQSAPWAHGGAALVDLDQSMSAMGLKSCNRDSVIRIPVRASSPGLPRSRTRDCGLQVRVGEDAASGRVYLAREDLKRFGVCEEALLADPLPNEARLLLAYYAERARIYYELADSLRPAEDRARLRPADAMGAIYHTLLDRLQADRLVADAQGHIGIKVWINNGDYEGDDHAAHAEAGKVPKKPTRAGKR